MKAFDLRSQGVQPVVVEDHVVGRRQALGARDLGRHDGAYLLFGHAIPGHHARHLQFLGTVDGQHARDPLAPGAGLDQQRHDEDRVGAGGHGRRGGGGVADARVQDGFEAGAGGGIGKHQRAHLDAVHGALKRGEVLPEFVQDGRHRRPVRSGQRVGDGVGVDQRRAEGAEHVGHRGLAAADAAGQADGECSNRRRFHVRQPSRPLRKPALRSLPQSRAIRPAAAR